MTLRYIMYCRKSTDSEDRQVQSIEDQQRELGYEVSRRGLKVIKTFTESQSAKEPGRPMFNDMLDMLKRGEADGILCWKLNRLARNPIDSGNIQWLLQHGIVKSIVTCGREYLPSDNILMMTVELGMANQFILDLSKDIKRGMRGKVEKGWRPGKAALGYLNDRYGDKGNKKLFKDEDRFHLVRIMWDMLLSGNYSVSTITKIITEKYGLRMPNGKIISLSNVFRIFNNPFYCGEFLYKGELYQGKHEPMITKDEFDLAQKLLGNKGRPRPQNKRLPFGGAIQCGKCGGMIVCEEKIKRNKTNNKIRRYLYHHCSHNKKYVSCSQPSISYQDLISQINGYFDQILIPEVLLQWAVDILKANEKTEQHRQEVQLRTQQKNYDAVMKRIDNLINLYVSPENADKTMLTEEEFKERKNVLTSEKTKLETEINKNGTAEQNKAELAVKAFDFATHAKHWFENGDYETKTKILRSLGQNCQLTDKKLNIELQKPLLIIKNGLEDKDLKKAKVELTDFIQPKTKTTPSKAVFEKWSR